jgi:UDP-N-acetylglucosamine/UDP-N-acetylgalactosamine diphosphorylase
MSSAASDGNPSPTSCDDLHALLAPWRQEHLLCDWATLTPEQHEELRQQIHALDLPLLRHLFHVKQVIKPLDPTQIEPPPVVRPPESFEDFIRQQEAADAGEEALRAGTVAIILVAGGQGTRLGHPGPKGTYAIGPVTQRTLFQIHAEKVLALSRRFQTPIRLCIMTSRDNDAETKTFFSQHRRFGLEEDQVHFFTQGEMPALDAVTGRILRAGPGRIATSPNGHGGSLQALADSGLLARFSEWGVQHLYYFQVDNPLVQVADPVFLGHHLQQRADLSVKVVRKTDPQERIGIVVRSGGKLQVIEYSELPDALANERDANGQLRHWAGNIAIHLLEVAFLNRLKKHGTMLPYHRAHKMMPYLDDAGHLVQPTQPNAYKFEMFIFDAMPMARKAMVLETGRATEFEPLKNATGDNSPDTVRQALSNLYAEWLSHSGVEVVRHPNGNAAVPVEISPLYALDAEELHAQQPALPKVTQPLVLAPGVPLPPQPKEAEPEDEEA